MKECFKAVLIILKIQRFIFYEVKLKVLKHNFVYSFYLLLFIIFYYVYFCTKYLNIFL